MDVKMKMPEIPCVLSHSEKKPCAIFVAIRGFALAKSRLQIMKSLRERGWRVIAAGNSDSHVQTLEEEGIEFQEISISRRGRVSWQDFRTYLQLVRLYRSCRPTLIHHFQAKPVILGCAAAKRYKPAIVVNTITGLGHAYIAGGLAQRIASTGYRRVLPRATKTIFQNPDDQQVFVDGNLVDKATCELIVSSGVNLEQFRMTNSPASTTLRVVMLARLLWEKGVGDFVEAARRCKKEMPKVQFQIAGEFSPEHPNGISKAQVEQWVQEGVVDYLGHISEVPKLLSKSSVVVLPSYREGVPRILLEAAACGIPTITTDAPGCREAVQNRVTGLITPVKDVPALAAAMRTLLSDEALRSRMGLAGRGLVEEHFDEQIIAQKYLALYRETGIQIPFDKLGAPDAKVA